MYNGDTDTDVRRCDNGCDASASTVRHSHNCTRYTCAVSRGCDGSARDGLIHLK